jgi:hypothetical protein
MSRLSVSQPDKRVVNYSLTVSAPSLLYKADIMEPKIKFQKNLIVS